MICSGTPLFYCRIVQLHRCLDDWFSKVYVPNSKVEELGMTTQCRKSEHLIAYFLATGSSFVFSEPSVLCDCFDKAQQNTRWCSTLCGGKVSPWVSALWIYNNWSPSSQKPRPGNCRSWTLTNSLVQQHNWMSRQYQQSEIPFVIDTVYQILLGHI